MQRHGWDWEQFEELLADPKRQWSRDLTAHGLDPAFTWSACEPALSITGDRMDGPEHTAVWLTLALAGRGSMGTPGSEVSLGSYLARLHSGRAQHRAILTAPQERATTVAQVIRALHQPEQPMPDPFLLARDLADVLGEDEDARRAVSRRWGRLSAEAERAGS